MAAGPAVRSPPRLLSSSPPDTARARVRREVDPKVRHLRGAVCARADAPLAVALPVEDEDLACPRARPCPVEAAVMAASRQPPGPPPNLGTSQRAPVAGGSCALAVFGFEVRPQPCSPEIGWRSALESAVPHQALAAAVNHSLEAMLPLKSHPRCHHRCCWRGPSIGD